MYMCLSYLHVLKTYLCIHIPTSNTYVCYDTDPPQIDCYLALVYKLSGTGIRW